MIGRRATVGLALLCAIAFSAIAVQSASAAAATKTTLVTCVKVTPGTGTFFDAHCDEDSSLKEGEFEHKPLKSEIGKTTEVVISNETTGGTTSVQKLKGLPFGVKSSIECTKATGTGSVGNTEPKAEEHKISGKATLEYSGCTALEPVKEGKKLCKVKEPIVATIGSAEGLEGLTGPNGEKEAMGIEYKSEAGKPFATITLENNGAEVCPLTGKPFPVEGSVIGTSGPGVASVQTNAWAGATTIFIPGSEMGKLTAGGKAAEYTGNTTLRMKGEEMWPITATTCTKSKPCN